MNEGWIKLHRKINDWEWKDKPLTLALFVHLLLNANHKVGKWRGVSVDEGSLLTGRKKLSEASGLSERQVRTSLNHLISTNEVTIKSTKEYSIISITNWKNYQSSDQQTANERPSSDQRPTTNKNDNNKKNEKKKEVNNFDRPSDVRESLWNDFITLRKSKRAPITQTAMDKICSEAAKVGWTLDQAIEQMVARNWQGFEAAWIQKDRLPIKSSIQNQVEEIKRNGW